MAIESISDVLDHVSKCLQLAILLEVSAYPKPGNVHRTFDFQETGYEHFLASTVALMPHFSNSNFRAGLKSVVKSTTAEDAVNVYDAIALAQPGGLGKAPQLDVTDAKSKKQILEQGVNLFEVFKISSAWDSISAEWVTNYHITFDIGYPFFKRQSKETRNNNVATVHTYLKILSEIPDTLIKRKAGADKAKWVSVQAEQILDAGGLTTKEGRSSLLKLDRKLRDKDHKLNPGTTADITSAILAVAILNGYRP